MKHLLMIAAASTALLAGCSMNGETSGMGMRSQGAMSAGMAGDMTPEERSAFAMMAASSDLFEIQSSQLALSRSQNGPIRQFAQMMISDHTMMTQQLMAAAQAAGLPPMTPRMLPMHAQMYARLQAAGTGRNFDNAYAREQVMAHEAALRLHQNYARRGDAPSLRAVANAAVPKVSAHLQMARRWPRG